MILPRCIPSQVPLSLSLGPLTTLSAGIGQAGRLGKGSTYRAARKPDKPVELWVSICVCSVLSVVLISKLSVVSGQGCHHASLRSPSSGCAS